MNIELLITYFIWSLCSIYIFIKIINYKERPKVIWLIIIGISVVLSFLLNILKPYILDPFRLGIIALLCSVFMWLLTKQKLDITVTAMITAFAITAVIYLISAVIAGGTLYALIGEYNDQYDYLLVTIMLSIQVVLTYLLFKIRRFKSGFPFLYNRRAAGIGLIISGIALTLFAIIDKSTPDNFAAILMSTAFLCAVGINIWVRRNITAVYIDKHKEREIAELQTELAEANAKVFSHAEVIHEYNHRFSMLERKVEKLIHKCPRNEVNAELANELSELFDIIKTISHNFSEDVENKLYSKADLPKTNLLLIDETFDYLQNQAAKSGIMFKLYINDGIKYMVESIIDENKLQTLISDHVKDAMIAIDFAKRDNGMIVVNFSAENGCYEFSVTDNGIPFKIDTLLSLGKKAVTTHADTGGTGIGFMTTFKTMAECKASLIITESADSKTVMIRFDDKNQYSIRSHRADELRTAYGDDDRIIIEDLPV